LKQKIKSPTEILNLINYYTDLSLAEMWWPGNYYMPLTPSNGNRCALTEAMKKASHPLDERL
jgi:hypothetical protein